VGLRGRWDRWFNIRLDRPRASNKYDVLPELIGDLGLETGRVYPKLQLAQTEIEEGRAHIRALVGDGDAPTVGVFVGGRKARGKRWNKEKFVDLVGRLRRAGARPVIFVGPEEREWLGYFQRKSAGTAPTVFENDVRKFASLVANCDVFVTCDGGPMHLACALRVYTVAMFLSSNVRRWAPPNELGRVVAGDVDVDSVFDACREELRRFSCGNRSPVRSRGRLGDREEPDQRRLS
jgi:heptosyltransferase-3